MVRTSERNTSKPTNDTLNSSRGSTKSNNTKMNTSELEKNVKLTLLQQLEADISKANRVQQKTAVMIKVKEARIFNKISWP